MSPESRFPHTLIPPPLHKIQIKLYFLGLSSLKKTLKYFCLNDFSFFFFFFFFSNLGQDGYKAVTKIKSSHVPNTI